MEIIDLKEHDKRKTPYHPACWSYAKVRASQCLKCPCSPQDWRAASRWELSNRKRLRHFTFLMLSLVPPFRCDSIRLLNGIKKQELGFFRGSVLQFLRRQSDFCEFYINVFWNFYHNFHLPSGDIAGGVPAKPIRKRFSDDTISALLNIKWWDWPKERIARHISDIQAGQIGPLQPLGEM